MPSGVARSLLGRRGFVLGAALSPFVGACGTAATSSLPLRSNGRSVELWSFFDLPQDTRSRELSGIAWDAENHVLWAVQDHTPRIVALVPDREFRTWRCGETIDVETTEAVDFEGLVAFRDGFYLCTEQGPHLIEVDRRGRFRSEIALPAHFREARANKSLESLTLSPSGRYLFTTSEAALERDGERATMENGTRVRILRIDRTNGSYTEHGYRTDAAPHEGGDWGISDLAAKSDTELYVLERGWTHGRGNTVRIYDTTLEDRASCGSVAELSDSTPVLSKSVRVDLGLLVTAGPMPPPKQPQPAPLLDNYEGLALGPRLPSGRQMLFVVSDDNGHATQFARILVLTL